MPELSIIVPVYKVEPYLRRCVDSILAQTFRDFELILVDDGSPDGCPDICDEYAAKDSRIIVIHQKNQGVSAARNAALDIARGEYIGFVDSDDWIEPEMYEKLIDAIKENGTDVAICGSAYADESGVSYRTAEKNELSLDQEELIKELFGKPNRIGGGCCTKVFCKKCLDNTRFDPAVAYAEDWIFLFNVFLHCPRGGKKIADPCYQVFERPNSATRGNSVMPYYRIISSSKLLLLLLLYRPQYAGIGIDKYLDDCERYVPMMVEVGKANHQPYRMKKLHIKLLMLRWILYGYFHKSLPRAKLNGHLVSMLKL